MRVWLAAADLENLSLPLDSYIPDGTAISTLERAQSIMFAQCMKRFGFDLSAPEPKLRPAKRNQERYGLADENQAKLTGYRPAASRPKPPHVAPTDLGPNAEAVAEGTGQRTYQGQSVPNDGCLGEARRKLLDGAPASKNPDLAIGLAGASFEESQQDSRTKKVFLEWRSCMKEAGYDYESPRDPNNDPALAGRQEPSALEIAVATTDVRCKAKVDLISVWASVEAAYQQRAVETKSQELAIVKKQLEIQLRNAANILAGVTGR
ncbi:MAG TPA: hypothetical protein DGG94_11030 [Micromonosporaceae bacterium]|nr:hypothetical protein [Micromonosporaceae bacterium]HCU50313.1 hypothetical protein [Micromonosporaceae bacterium]